MKTNNKRYWMFRDFITGAFAKWAVRQSPYSYPAGLEKGLKILDTELNKEIAWDTNGMARLSFDDILAVLNSVVKNPSNGVFVQWNTPKKGKNRRFIFTSRYDKQNPDYDIIDLDALVRNTVRDIMEEIDKEQEFERRLKSAVYVKRRKK